MNTINSADICVIGGGICGALLARKLALAGSSVLMLESGPRVGRGELVERYRHSAFKSDFMAPYPFSEMSPHPVFTPEANKYIEQVGPHAFQAQYIRMLGGTSWHWAAQMWRYLPSDFKTQSLYGVGKDWPISYE